MFKILFPSSLMDSNEVDLALKDEYNAAIRAGFDVLLFDQEKWYMYQVLKMNITNMGEEPIEVLFRGFRMLPCAYREFNVQLKYLGYHLIIEPNEYENMYAFQKMYSTLREDCVPIIRFPMDTLIDVEFIKNKLGKFMIKDNTICVKECGFPAFFDQNTTQEEFDSWITRLSKYHKDMSTDELYAEKYYDDIQNVCRVFYYKNMPLCMTNDSVQPPVELIHKYEVLNSPFFTIDFAQFENGTWKIIDCQDGQISLVSNEPEKLYYSLSNYS